MDPATSPLPDAVLPDELEGVELRPITPADLEFLYQLYANTREEELALTDWGAEDKERFLRMQFSAQDQHYRQYYPGAKLEVILEQGQPIGRFYVARWESEIRLMDIALVPAVRGRGIGTALVRQLLAEGQSVGKKVSIHVEMYNPAFRLYKRLGFRRVEEKGVYFLMVWSPQA